MFFSDVLFLHTPSGKFYLLRFNECREYKLMC